MVGDHRIGDQAENGVGGGPIHRRGAVVSQSLPERGVAEIKVGWGYTPEGLGTQVAVMEASAGVRHWHKPAEAVGVVQVERAAGGQGLGAHIVENRVAAAADVRHRGAAQQGGVGLRQLVEVALGDGDGEGVAGAAHVATHLQVEVVGLNGRGHLQAHRGLGGGCPREQQGAHITLQRVIEGIPTYPLGRQGRF